MYLPRVPAGQAPAQLWSDNEYTTKSGQVTLDATGAGQVTLPVVPQGHQWLIDRVVVKTTSGVGGPGAVLLYVDQVDDLHLVDGTDAGSFDVNDADSPIQVDGGSQLIAVWSGGRAGDVATVNVHYLDQRHTGGQ